MIIASTTLKHSLTYNGFWINEKTNEIESENSVRIFQSINWEITLINLLISCLEFVGNIFSNFNVSLIRVIISTTELSRRSSLIFVTFPFKLLSWANVNFINSESKQSKMSANKPSKLNNKVNMVKLI